MSKTSETSMNTELRFGRQSAMRPTVHLVPIQRVRTYPLASFNVKLTILDYNGRQCTVEPKNLTCQMIKWAVSEKRLPQQWLPQVIIESQWA